MMAWTIVGIQQAHLIDDAQMNTSALPNGQCPEQHTAAAIPRQFHCQHTHERRPSGAAKASGEPKSPGGSENVCCGELCQSDAAGVSVEKRCQQRSNG